MTTAGVGATGVGVGAGADPPPPPPPPPPLEGGGVGGVDTTAAKTVMLSETSSAAE